MSFEEGDTIKIWSTDNWDFFKELVGFKSFVIVDKTGEYNRKRVFIPRKEHPTEIPYLNYATTESWINPKIYLHDDYPAQASFVSCKMLLIETKSHFKFL